MARRAARYERAGALTPRDRMWAALRALGECSAAEVAHLSGQRPDSVRSYLDALAAAGLIVREQERCSRLLDRYRLLTDTGVDAPRLTRDGRPVTQGVGRKRMWDALRTLREFDHRELAALASDAQHQVAEDEAQTYCKHLLQAGYLTISREAQRGRCAAPRRLRFVPARNSGPRAPMVTARKEVLDANTGRIVYPAPREATTEELGRYDHE